MVLLLWALPCARNYAHLALRFARHTQSLIFAREKKYKAGCVLIKTLLRRGESSRGSEEAGKLVEKNLAKSKF